MGVIKELPSSFVTVLGIETRASLTLGKCLDTDAF